MDAKPQRATRLLRDENANPLAVTQKTIHQRNKSSPALSSMLQNGASKTKRAAFGDISNTANAVRPSKDDSDLGSKNHLKIFERPSFAQPEKKNVTLQRPAQRPLSVNVPRTILGSVTIPSKEQAVKELSVDVQKTIPLVQQEVHKKFDIKKSTAVLKDPPTASEEQPSLLSQPSAFPASSVPPVHRGLLSHPDPKISQHMIEPQLRRTQSKLVESNVVTANEREDSTEPKGQEEPPLIRSDGLFIDENGAVRVYEFEDAVENLEETVELAGARVSSHPAKPEEGRAKTNQYADFPISQTKVEAIHQNMFPPVSEPEEYWDEDVADTYEEEGYVTARSFKSRTDNTTGNATTVLFPKVTQKVKKEIAAAKELVEASKTVEELEDEAWDTTMVAEYGDEIFQYMRDLEIKMLPNAHYMDNQAEIQWSMRAVLIDWIVQVHHRFNLLPETLFLCVNYIDRFLSCKVVSLGKLQLVGATAIFIAAKYEEIDCPSVNEIVYMVDSGYTVDEILKAERFMLSMLQFELGWPGPMSFLRRISKADDYDLETRTLAKYFLEITIMDERFVGSPPSYVAAGAHCLARMMLRKGAWSPAHVYYSNYTYSQLFNLVLLMVECCEEARKHHCAVFDKYTDKRYKRASLFAETEMNKGFMVLDIASNNFPFANAYDYRSTWDHKQQPVGQVY